MSRMNRYHGKYRGKVCNNVDPEFLGRIQVIVPDVSALLPSTWALPCVPVATLKGGVFALPEIEDDVWVEFERGHPDHPIWVGGFWTPLTAPLTIPLANPALPPIILSTVLQSAVIVSDSPIPPMTGPGVAVMATEVSFISVSPEMIQIVSPTIQINGVTIVNDGALMVTL
jgi:hypothetical protein